MADQVFGSVKPASTTTALRATNNAPAITGQAIDVSYFCQAIQFQAVPTNTGIVYIVDRQTPTLTLHVKAAIPAPVAGVIPAWVIGDPDTDEGLDLTTYWILPAVSGEGVNVLAMR